jgi:hypothetical protein
MFGDSFKPQEGMWRRLRHQRNLACGVAVTKTAHFLAARGRMGLIGRIRPISPIPTDSRGGSTELAGLP